MSTLVIPLGRDTRCRCRVAIHLDDGIHHHVNGEGQHLRASTKNCRFRPSDGICQSCRFARVRVLGEEGGDVVGVIVGVAVGARSAAFRRLIFDVLQRPNCVPNPLNSLPVDECLGVACGSSACPPSISMHWPTMNSASLFDGTNPAGFAGVRAAQPGNDAAIS